MTKIKFNIDNYGEMFDWMKIHLGGPGTSFKNRWNRSSVFINDYIVVEDISDAMWVWSVWG